MIVILVKKPSIILCLQKTIGKFISRDAFVESGPEAQEKVDEKTIQTTAQRSTPRVAQDKEFKEITEEIKKAKEEEDKGIVLGDSFGDRKDKQDEFEKKKNFSEKEKIAEYHKRPDVREAVNVLVDLIDIQSKVPLKIAIKDVKVKKSDVAEDTKL